MNIALRLFSLAALGLALCNHAQAEPMDRAWMFAGNDRFAEVGQICKDGEASEAVPACNEALDLVAKSNLKGQAYLLLKRSSANLALHRFSEAIADADEGARLLPGSREMMNQRCWTRAVANQEIALARAICMKVFDESSANSALLTSLALAEARECNWYAAGEHYFAAYVMNPEKFWHARYAFVLMTSARKNIVGSKDYLYQLIMDGQLSQLTKNQIEDAQRKYAALGLTIDDLVPGKVKCPARQPKSDDPSLLPSFTN